MRKWLFLFLGLIGAIILLMIGYNQIINAVSDGLKIGAKLVDASAGMDGELYQRLVTETIHCYQIAGGILASIGGAGILISLFEIKKELK